MPNLPLGAYVVLGSAALAALVFLTDRLLLWMERRGWIYYRTLEPRIKGGARGVLGAFQEIVQPEIRHVQEDRDQRRAASDQPSPSDR